MGGNVNDPVMAARAAAEAAAAAKAAAEAAAAAAAQEAARDGKAQPPSEDGEATVVDSFLDEDMIAQIGEQLPAEQVAGMTDREVPEATGFQTGGLLDLPSIGQLKDDLTAYGAATGFKPSLDATFSSSGGGALGKDAFMSPGEGNPLPLGVMFGTPDADSGGDSGGGAGDGGGSDDGEYERWGPDPIGPATAEAQDAFESLVEEIKAINAINLVEEHAAAAAAGEGGEPEGGEPEGGEPEGGEPEGGEPEGGEGATPSAAMPVPDDDGSGGGSHGGGGGSTLPPGGYDLGSLLTGVTGHTPRPVEDPLGPQGGDNTVNPGTEGSTSTGGSIDGTAASTYINVTDPPKPEAEVALVDPGELAVLQPGLDPNTVNPGPGEMADSSTQASTAYSPTYGSEPPGELEDPSSAMAPADDSLGGSSDHGREFGQSHGKGPDDGQGHGRDTASEDEDTPLA